MTKPKYGTVSVRLNEVTKEAIDQIIAEERVKHGKRLTNDGAIWLLIREAFPHIEKRVTELRGDIPKDIETDQRFKAKPS